MDKALAPRLGSIADAGLIQTQRCVVNEELLKRFIAYVDVKEKSIKTYYIAVKQFIRYINDTQHKDFKMKK
jgi:hypothetical protein